MSDPISDINRAVHRMAMAQTAAVEKACEQALQGGVCGVSVTTTYPPMRPIDEDQQYTLRADVHIRVDPSVPYGTIEYRKADWPPLRVPTP